MARIANQAPGTEKLTDGIFGRKVCSECHHGAGTDAVAHTQKRGGKQQSPKTVGKGNGRHCDCLDQKAGYHGEFSSVPVHNMAGGIEERHVHQGRNCDDPPDGMNVKADHVGGIQGHDNVAPGSNGLGKELPGSRGGKFPKMRFENRQQSFVLAGPDGWCRTRGLGPEFQRGNKNDQCGQGPQRLGTGLPVRSACRERRQRPDLQSFQSGECRRRSKAPFLDEKTSVASVR